jgi:glycogen debranching enzyme
MDKMGSSERAKTKGCPATSRNGVPVELVGLLKFSLTKFDELYNQGKIKFNTVKLNDQIYTFAEWADRIQKNFEKWFWIPEDINKND